MKTQNTTQPQKRARTQNGLARLIVCIVGFALITASAIAVVHMRTSEMHAGYALHALMQKKARLVQERAKLNLEISALIRPERLERLAPKFDLVPPRSERVLIGGSK